MRVLVGCEYSGRVRQAFRDLGHDAWSCDFLDAEDGSPYHIKGDVVPLLDQGWDIGIFHPTCTYLTGAAEWCYKDDPGKKMAPGVLFGAARRQAREEALDFVRLLMNAPIPGIAVENPVGVIGTRIRKADQIIQPWWFGDDASKKTCLWLKNLPPLVETNRLPGDDKTRRGNQTASGQNKLGPSPDRWKERSRTYPGIAAAMALQWGGPLRLDEAKIELDRVMTGVYEEN